MDIHVLLMVVVRVVVVYAFLLGVVRLLGKRKLGDYSAFDLVIAVLLADLASEVVFGTVTLVHGLLAVGMIAAVHYGKHHLAYASPWLQHWLGGSPTVLVRDGEVQPHALRSERLSEATLLSLLRAEGAHELAEVKLAMLEPNGQLSVVRQDWAQPARQRDLTVVLQGGEA